MTTTEKLLKIVDRIADLTADERVRLGRILVDQYSQDACDVKDGIEDGFAILEKELGLV
jgi:signal transduction histidine kinase